MCNLYAQRKPREELRGLFKISGNRIGEIKDQAAIFPRGLAPVIRKAEDGDLEVVEMTWGFIRKQPGYAPKPVTNFRDDKARSNPFWRSAVQKRRCLVPATSFCEPAEVTPATWHWFGLKGDDPRPLFAFAGIWQPYDGPLNGRDQKNGVTHKVNTFSFLTTVPNELVATINHERMVVILTRPEEFDQWLNGTVDEAMELAKPFSAEMMQIVQEGLSKQDDLLAAA